MKELFEQVRAYEESKQLVFETFEDYVEYISEDPTNFINEEEVAIREDLLGKEFFEEYEQYLENTFKELERSN